MPVNWNVSSNSLAKEGRWWIRSVELMDWEEFHYLTKKMFIRLTCTHHHCEPSDFVPDLFDTENTPERDICQQVFIRLEYLLGCFMLYELTPQLLNEFREVVNIGAEQLRMYPNMQEEEELYSAVYSITSFLVDTTEEAYKSRMLPPVAKRHVEIVVRICRNDVERLAS